MHLTEVLERVVPLGAREARERAEHRLRLAGAGEVQHLHAAVEQLARRPGHGRVEALRAQRAPGHEERGQRRVEAEGRGGRRPRASAVVAQSFDELRHLAAQRQTRHDGARERRPRERHPDLGGPACPELVREARPGVLLVHDHRHAASPGREVRGRRDVPTEPDDRLGADPVDRLARGVDGRLEPPGQAGPLAGRPARQRDAREELERVAAFRDEPRLEPFAGAERDDARVGPTTAQLVRDGEQRVDVPGRPAAREDDGLDR